MLDLTLERYKNTLPYQPWGSKDGKAYFDETQKLNQLFFDDCAQAYGYVNNLKREQLESIAYDKGHSSGLLEIHNWILELLPLIT